MNLRRALLLALLLCGALLGIGTPGYAQLPNLAPGEIDIPNDFAKNFIVDYQSGDAAKVGKWIHPRRGVIDTRVIKTREAFLASYPALTSVLKTNKISYRFGEGYFNGDRFYKAIYPQTGGQFGKIQTPISLLCVFERIGDTWYLVQAHRFDTGSQAWLLVGDLVADDRLIGSTLSGRKFSMQFAQEQKHAVLLSFDDQVQDAFRDDNINHLKAVKKWYVELKGKPIYVMNISEYSKDLMTNYLSMNKLMLPVVLDEKSEWHHSLQVDQHPFLMLVDHEGRLRAMHRENFDTAAYGVFRLIVSDVVNAVPVKGTAQKSGTKTADPSKKF